MKLHPSPPQHPLFADAVRFHQTGQPAQAEPLYRQILSDNPNHADALCLLGVLTTQTNRADVGIDLLRRAVALVPGHPFYLSNLGSALHMTGQFEQAVECCLKAIAVKPDYAEAHGNLGNALKSLGRFDEAIVSYRNVIKLFPGDPRGYYNLGTALHENKQFEDAIASLEQAVRIRPDFAEAHFNLGNVLHDADRDEEAAASFRRAVALTPDKYEPRVGLGQALCRLKIFDEAQATLQAALALSPKPTKVFVSLGTIYAQQGRSDEAIDAYRRALSLDPNSADALFCLGNAYKDLGMYAEAYDCCIRAIQLKPDEIKGHSNFLLALNYHPDFDAAALCSHARDWNRRHAARFEKQIQPHNNDRSPDRRLRIGYVSADFYGHASAYFLDPLLRSHDREQVEILCYSHVASPDAFTHQFQSLADHWRTTVGVSDDRLAGQIRDDRIDILVDLKLHSSYNRLLVFARKPAPVQIAWLGYPGTSGLPTIDYRLTDSFLEPPGFDVGNYSEKSLLLPDCFWCYDPLAKEIPVSALPAISAGHITFGCLNTFSKITRQSLELWARVLHAVPQSRLLLLASEGYPRRRAMEVLHAAGIDSQRIRFVAPCVRNDYLKLYHQIDLCLDPIPCPGHTTTLDALWMAVPVVTLPGTTAVSRAGVSILSNLGCPEWIASSDDDFVRIAAALAGDLPRLSKLRAELRQKMQDSPLMDGPRFARAIEAAFRTAWKRWCSA